jgi:anthranilate phosphoribosyltransferase
VPVLDPVARAIHALAERRDLDSGLTEDAFTQVMSGQATAAQMAALLMGLRMKGETAAEVVGAVRALRGAMVPLLADTHGLVDTCGTGGGKIGTFNISTAAAMVAAGAGARVAKHGNRSFTSQSGSADVLEALGMTLPTTPAAARRLLDASGMTFLFAPLFHPAMKHVGPIRRELAMHTVMNILGPLANPASVKYQVVGVADPARGPLIAGALAALGSERALVVHARAGMDEISPVGATDVWEVRDGAVRQWVIEPEPLRLADGRLEELAGGTPADNARTTENVLANADRSVRRSAVMINAAAALVAAGIARDMAGGVDAARAAIESGKARAVLDLLVTESRGEASTS